MKAAGEEKHPAGGFFFGLQAVAEDHPVAGGGQVPPAAARLMGTPSLVEGFFMRRGSLGRWFDGRPNAGATPARRTTKIKKAAAGLRRPTLLYLIFSREREFLERIPTLFTFPDSNQNISIASGPSINSLSPLAWSFTVEKRMVVYKVVVLFSTVVDMNMDTLMFLLPT